MIVRILGEGQYRLDDEAFAAASAIDDRVQSAADSDDDPAFRQALGELLDVVTDRGAPLPADELHPSDAIVPGHGTTLAGGARAARGRRAHPRLTGASQTGYQRSSSGSIGSSPLSTAWRRSSSVSSRARPARGAKG